MICPRPHSEFSRRVRAQTQGSQGTFHQVKTTSRNREEPPSASFLLNANPCCSTGRSWDSTEQPSLLLLAGGTDTWDVIQLVIYPPLLLD